MRYDIWFSQTRARLATVGYMVPAALLTKMGPGVKQVCVVDVPYVVRTRVCHNRIIFCALLAGAAAVD